MRARNLHNLAGALLVSISAIAANAANAADITCCEPPSPPPILEGEASASGWYLRGDIGFSNQSAKLDSASFATATNYQLQQSEFSAAPFFGVGLGYRFNSWFRGDLTMEYRGGATYHGLDTFTGNVGGTATDMANVYTGKKSEITGLVNAYADLGTWAGITPYIGAGVGMTYNTISGFTDTNVIGSAVGWAPEQSTSGLAWAVMAGLGYQIQPGLTMELGYRYLNLGDADIGTLRDASGASPSNIQLEYKDIVSHDFKLGMRWELGGGETVAYAPPAPVVMEPAPLITK